MASFGVHILKREWQSVVVRARGPRVSATSVRRPAHKFSTRAPLLPLLVSLPPAPSARREAPTGVIYLTSGQGQGRVLERVERACRGVGFTFARVSVPWGARAGLPADDTDVDDAVDAVRAAILSAGMSLPPIAIAPAHHAVFVQKYLESFPVSALVCLAPLPPSPSPTVHAWVGTHGGDVARGVARTFGAGSPFLHDVGLLEALSLPRTAVNLEPLPVPMLVCSPALGDLPRGGREGGRDTGPPHWLTREEVEATLEMHGLDAEDEEACLWLASGGGVEGEGGVDVLAALWGHAHPHGGAAGAEVEEQTAAAVAERVASWISARF